jgi:hypothetical protein
MGAWDIVAKWPNSHVSVVVMAAATLTVVVQMRRAARN